MTCGLLDVNKLVDILQKYQWRDFPSALQEYSTDRVVEDNAVTELNYVPNRNFLFVLINNMRRWLGRPDFNAYILDPREEYSSILEK